MMAQAIIQRMAQEKSCGKSAKTFSACSAKLVA
jgi:hypothetical protein